MGCVYTQGWSSRARPWRRDTGDYGGGLGYAGEGARGFLVLRAIAFLGGEARFGIFWRGWCCKTEEVVGGCD